MTAQRTGTSPVPPRKEQPKAMPEQSMPSQPSPESEVRGQSSPTAPPDERSAEDTEPLISGPEPAANAAEEKAPRPAHRRERRAQEREKVAIDVAGQSDLGCVRKRNEDQYLIAELDRWLVVHDTSLPLDKGDTSIGGRQGWMLAVADGIGGRMGGDLASSAALQSLIRYATFAMPWVIRLDEAGRRDLIEELGQALERCQMQIEELAHDRGLGDAHPGTTLTLAYVIWPHLHVMHIGDSRCYLLRDGVLERLTHDHTVAERLAENDMIRPEDLERSPFRNMLDNAITGGCERPRIEVQSRRLRVGDCIMLCTDGLTDELAPELVRGVLGEETSAAAGCQRLVQLAREAGGHDNITAVVARFPA